MLERIPLSVMPQLFTPKDQVIMNEWEKGLRNCPKKHTTQENQTMTFHQNPFFNK